MSLLSTIQQSAGALQVNQVGLQVVGNNIANANTYGSKAARAEFSDVYAAALGGTGGSAIGIGVNMAAVAQQFSQGNITTTSNAMDLALNGAGFFQVTDGNSPVTYTRNGQFKVDREGFIVNNAGQQLMGYAADADGQIQPGLAVPIQLPTGGVSPTATTNIAIELNLDSRRGDFLYRPSAAQIDLAARPDVGIPRVIGTRSALDDGRIAERWWRA